MFMDAPWRVGREAPENASARHRNRGELTSGGPFPVADGREVRQAAATGELVARAVAVVFRPVTFIPRR
ncbi:hypothetical protein SCATT_p02310 (plasmid) [Streptantibioticus cattleyicolor NRRL 8057 = DSM 46488]|uniref:Uncharacterized protein n=1 Tax=Streptantibioticus cattleyicolor (strain ATCC 35852 / DSM 46488 / JCM 4925 / NBRC 14057 / NRRL 8057) TaxID=1003195 RepID=G8XEX3_STREN|nr:hypothetical protein SCATT_p02310 [Streptantibioticus cattleyicolor NRRL 8057 = DSM 46488]